MRSASRSCQCIALSHSMRSSGGLGRKTWPRQPRRMDFTATSRPYRVTPSNAIMKAALSISPAVVARDGKPDNVTSACIFSVSVAGFQTSDRIAGVIDYAFLACHVAEGFALGE